MGTEKVGLMESVSMAIGGMVGGGIFAVLGVVAVAAGRVAWLAFIVAGGIALCASYSFIRLNRLTEKPVGPISFATQFTGSTTLAGMVGWTFVFGYIGTMSMCTLSRSTATSKNSSGSTESSDYRFDRSSRC